ncbi:MAG: hydrogenase maturation protease [Armatimonadetes bacterium]|nr:hydrogenase maturation protease [Armatimonadota bacterium]
MITADAPASILIVGIGNVLRGDDGFGPAVLAEVQKGSLPAGTRLAELGIGGIGLVHELMDGYDLLIVIDAVERGGSPGDLYILEPDQQQMALSAQEVGGTDMHAALPDQTIKIAKSLGVLPAQVRIVGCEPGDMEDVMLELTPPVAAVVPQAANAVREIIASFLGAKTGAA